MPYSQLFLAALTTIFAKIGVQNIDANLATAVRTVVIVVIAWGLVFAEGNLNQLTTISGRTLAFLIISGVATGLSWLFYFKALQVGKAAQVAPIDKSSVVLVIFILCAVSPRTTHAQGNPRWVVDFDRDFCTGVGELGNRDRK